MAARAGARIEDSAKPLLDNADAAKEVKTSEVERFKVKKVEELDPPGKKARLIVAIDELIGR